MANGWNLADAFGRVRSYYGRAALLLLLEIAAARQHTASSIVLLHSQTQANDLEFDVIFPYRLVCPRRRAQSPRYTVLVW